MHVLHKHASSTITAHESFLCSTAFGFTVEAFNFLPNLKSNGCIEVLSHVKETHFHLH